MNSEESIKLSRVGKIPVTVPSGVDVKIEKGMVTVRGPKGNMSREVHPRVQLVRDGDDITVAIEKGDRESRAVQGLTRALLANMVNGVSVGFERKLEIQGVGYKAELKSPTEILFSLGYSHPIMYELPVGVTGEVTKDNKVILRSNNKETLGLAAAKIRSFRPPEPYKGKGIRYEGEHVRRKAGKTAAR